VHGRCLRGKSCYKREGRTPSDLLFSCCTRKSTTPVGGSPGAAPALPQAGKPFGTNARAREKIMQARNQAAEFAAVAKENAIHRRLPARGRAPDNPAARQNQPLLGATQARADRPASASQAALISSTRAGRATAHPAPWQVGTRRCHGTDQAGTAGSRASHD